MKLLGIFLLSGMLAHYRVTTSVKFASTHLYTWVERGTVRVKCLAQEYNARVLGLLDPEWTALTMRPPRLTFFLPRFHIVKGVWSN